MFDVSISYFKVLFPVVAFVAGGFFVGLIVERALISRLKKLATKTPWEGDKIILSAFKRTVTLWATVAGIYAASGFLDLGETISRLIDKLFLIVLISSATLVVARITEGLVNLYARRNHNIAHSISILSNVTKLIIYITGLLIILNSLGISITPILTALGVGGLAVALALRDTLANLFSGLHILVSRQIRLGQYIKLDSGDEGYVQDINWRTTSLLNPANYLIIVPNQKIASASITNYDLPDQELAVRIPLMVSYKSDLDRIEKIIDEVAGSLEKEQSSGAASWTPTVRYVNFGDYGIKLTVVLRTTEFKLQPQLIHNFLKILHRRFGEEGIAIPSPNVINVTGDKNA